MCEWQRLFFQANLLIRTPHGGQHAAEDEEDERIRAADEIISTSQSAFPLLEPTLRQCFKAIVILLVGQQLSGINGVVFYSSSILKKIFPVQAEIVTVGLAATNLIMTLPSIILSSRYARKPLLLISAIFMAIFSLCMAAGLNSQNASLTVAACIGFISAFSIGLGPIPFLIGMYSIVRSSLFTLTKSWGTV